MFCVPNTKSNGESSRGTGDFYFFLNPISISHKLVHCITFIIKKALKVIIKDTKFYKYESGNFGEKSFSKMEIMRVWSEVISLLSMEMRQL